ncbi:hypothetical protein SLH46_20240 [Draconibacterium sp. IB214405]|uniref:hypothetical protein n=1 Tax=Draconibacterium sp. IB214405 TaxID=3097352 RepID=UPI002A0E7033|nr:hypothetical protein [Draconibacterium sp. IB214405]MDX8341540.1 hypothetical protein [Draconibacterium sp. IB214405]
MDDIVVIILTLIVAVFGILNKKRKRDVPPGQSAPTNGGAQNFWEMLLENENDSQQVVQPPVYKEEIVEEPVPKPKPVYEFKADREAAHSITKPMKKMGKSKKKKLIMGEEFSLKKAVIYSEIINRKYI